MQTTLPPAPEPVQTPSKLAEGSWVGVPVEAAYQVLAQQIAAYLPADKLASVRQAFELAEHAHGGQGQLRKSGEAYVMHPLAVAELCVAYKLDAHAICAALLHDCVEDTSVSIEQVQAQFGAEVAHLVDGLTKLNNLKSESLELQQAENLRKLVLAMSKDIRVMLIKLCDRLHNMRTLASLDAARQRRISQETLDIYAHIAHRLGLNEMYRELQNLAFMYRWPKRYALIAAKVNENRSLRKDMVERTRRDLSAALKKAGLEAQVFGREKTLYSIYRKMRKDKKSFHQIHDVFGFRVVLDIESDCYRALGAVHKVFTPDSARFRDFIAVPKPNGYQSLHTTVKGRFGGNAALSFEVQLHTLSMHRVAENGVASHWLYKAGNAAGGAYENQLEWIRSLLQLDAGGDAKEFLEHLKTDLYPDSVYVYTPKGKIIALPQGATAIDFAYAVHSVVGNTCVACTIDGQHLPLRTELKTGNTVSIETSPSAKPNINALAFARTAKAKAEIRAYARGLSELEAEKQGEQILGFALSQQQTLFTDISPAQWQRTLRELGMANKDELFLHIAWGRRPAVLVARMLSRAGEKNNVAGKKLTLNHTSELVQHFAKCCGPVRGDHIMGKYEPNTGLMIHRFECHTFKRQHSRDADAWFELDWDETPHQAFATQLSVSVKNGRGVLSQIAGAITEAGANIGTVRNEEEPGNTATLYFTVYVDDRKHLAQVIKALRAHPFTLKVDRV